MKWTEPAGQVFSVIICEMIFKRHLFQFIIIIYICKACMCVCVCKYMWESVSVQSREDIKPPGLNLHAAVRFPT